MSGAWTMRKALFCLMGSVFATLSLSLGGYLAWSKQNQKKLFDEKYKVISIMQTGPEKEALKTTYLAELLGLSADRFISLYSIDVKQAEKKLLSSPLIKSAFVKRLPPSAIYIDYEVRKPVAMLADYKNTAIDAEGYLFPLTPFFSPKEIPEIYLGLPPFGADADALGRHGGQWLIPLQNPLLNIAFDVLRFLEDVPWKEGFRVKRIDVSNALAPSLGQREIVVFTEEEWVESSCVFPKILRISPTDYAQQLANFFVLRRNMEEAYRKQLSGIGTPTRFSARIIDLRIPQLAFVQNQN